MNAGIRHRLARADVAIPLLLAVVFVAAYLQTGQWPFRTALFPEVITVAGAAFAVLRTWLAVARRRPPPEQPAGPQIGGVTVLDDEEAEEQSVEYVFANAGRRAWIEALGWVFAFFAGLYAAGLYVTVPLFTAAYLRLAGRTSWLVAGIYAAVATLVLYLAFTQVLRVPVPSGLFG